MGTSGCQQLGGFVRLVAAGASMYGHASCALSIHAPSTSEEKRKRVNRSSTLIRVCEISHKRESHRAAFDYCGSS